MSAESHLEATLPPPEKIAEGEWHALDVQAVLRHLEVQEGGLTSEQVARRLQHYGPNELREAPRPTFWQMLWEQLNNFVVWLLIAASLVSALLGDYLEAS
ncbi:MAG: cation-transporting P-type ATPase, partial [Anaerolineae bacterium]